MLRHTYNQIWDQLRGKKPHMLEFLEQVTIEGLRGIKKLSVPFTYPVSVIAGPNACGKSTVLFSLAAAYAVAEAGQRDFYPSTLFPDFLPKDTSDYVDKRLEARIEYSYKHGEDRFPMVWSRRKQWNRSFKGRKNVSQPRRQIYLRTLANLSNPSEVRGVLQFYRSAIEHSEITADLLLFAQRILPTKYGSLIQFTKGARSLLFACQESGDQYSEFHMSSGERAILRLSKDISGLRNALVLIDEVEAGLHPHTQQQLMLELQRLALRNELQVVVTTHSPIVLDCVPQEAKLFLERVNGDVVLRPPYKDILEKAFYGLSQSKLSILCEDESAEGILRGIAEIVCQDVKMSQNEINVGRDTGKSEFPGHVAALAKFNKLDDFIFVVDGDATQEDIGKINSMALKHGKTIPVLTLPGTSAPEAWVWSCLFKRCKDYAGIFGVSEDDLRSQLNYIDAAYGGAADSPSNIAKSKMISLSDWLVRSVSEICRACGRLEAETNNPALVELIAGIVDKINLWRTSC